jgi:hypothetical protein
MADEPSIQRHSLRWVGVITALFLVVVLVRVNEFVDLSETALERLEFIKSPSLRLAENTARSNFSDGLTRLAWRRMYWARLAAQRVVDEAPLGEIDAAWSTYINASADWNAEVMIFIVGLEKYYGSQRRYDFEDKILGSFTELDDALRSVRRSRIMNKLRAPQVPDEADRSEIEKLFANVKAKHTDLNIAMYEFAHIAMPGKR